LKYGYGSLCLALTLSTAAPAFADNIHARFGEGDGMFGVMQRSRSKNALRKVSPVRNFGVRTFTEVAFRIGSNPEVRMSDFTEDDGISNLIAPLNSKSGPDDHPARWIDFGSNKGDSSGKDDEKARWKHIARDQIDANARLSAVAVPELGSETLLLLGSAGLGVIAYRRNARKDAN
jgi:hypothetical protein